MPYNTVDHSTFIDFAGYRITTETTAEAAYGITDARLFNGNTEWGINVALILPRVEEPTAMLAGDWGSRQRALQQLNESGTLWSKYGADQAQFDHTVDFLRNDLGLTVLDSTNSNYVTSAESRTVWVAINTQADFQALFDKPLFYSEDQGLWFWRDELRLPTELTVKSLWIDMSTVPPGSNMTPGVSVNLPAGPQSIGNSAPTVPATNFTPQHMGELYNFPLHGKNVQTATVGLIEPGIGSALPNDVTGSQFQSLLTAYLASIGQTGDGLVSVQGADGQSYDNGAGERSLDVGVVAGVNPNSDIVLFNGSGWNGNAKASTFTAIQSAIFDPAYGITAWSDSFGDAQSMSPDSPFYRAYWDLFVDSALANKTGLSALGDGGSGNETGNGLTNLEYNCTQPYGLLVGGSSLSVLSAASADSTLMASIVEPAMHGDRAVIWRLVSGGLTSLPVDAAATEFFVETVWNWYGVTDRTIANSSTFFGGGGYLQNTASSGGVDPTQPTPDYQLAYGLHPVTADPLAEPGRGAPDVTANAGGNATYLVPGDDMQGQWYDFGTSAASPLWMGLIAQFNTIFADQGLPYLGYMNDLLYIASAIAPASFNDVTLGNNISSWVSGGDYTSSGEAITPTGFGFYAGPGYDYVSGLGSPNGVLLGRSLTAIAHSQMWFEDNPDMLDGDGAGGWTSGTDQSLIFQTMSHAATSVDVGLGSGSLLFASAASGAYAWTNRLAQQALQEDFDPRLVRMYDKESQGWLSQSFVTSGEDVSVSIGASPAQAIQGTLSSPFGFADFVSSDGAVRVARAVAVAETAGAHDDQVAIVRVRQNGEDSLSLTFYRVDDLAGTIDGLAPGAAGYLAAADARAYQLASGATSLGGPGYGNFAQSALLDVDAGDLIAMKLTNLTSGAQFLAFASANEQVAGQQVGHLWSYGQNTWGWEDTLGGGDRDFNDLIVGLDFTSAYGSGWLI